jgi:hypothetical protein
VAAWTGWVVAQFSSSGVKTGFFNGGTSFALTAASISTMTSSATARPWTGNLPGYAFGHTLVVDSPVHLDFGFTALPGPIASFSATVNGEAVSLASASVVGTSVRVAYTALAAIEHTFVFTAIGQSRQFVVPASAVFAYPTVGATTRSPDTVTLGQPVRLTTSFLGAMPAGATATVVVTPQGQTAVSRPATVSGAGVVVDHTVAFDAEHAGAITVAYGPTSKVYYWGAGTLTAGNIYTFPSGFTYSGAANGYGRPTSGYGLGAQIALKQGTAGSLTLTFAGGDMIHSSAASAQVEHVKYVQDGIETTVPASSLSCSDPLETVTVSSLTVASTTALTLRVKLRGPDGASGPEFAVNIPSAEIASAVANVYFVDDYPRQIVGSGIYAWTIQGQPTAGIWITPNYYAAFFSSWGNTLVARFDGSNYTGKSRWVIGVSMESRTVANIDASLNGNGIAFTWTGNGPTAIVASTLDSARLAVGTALAGQTLTLTGTRIKTLAQASISVYLSTSSTQVSNCIVTGFSESTGVVTFTVTPSVTGMCTLYVLTAGSPAATVAYAGSAGLGFFVDYADVASAAQSTVLATSGCSWWYDGSDPNGTGVAPATNTSLPTLVDKSGHARNATCTTTPKATFVAGVVGTRGCVRFAGGSLAQYDSPTSFTLATSGPWTIFVVMNVTKEISGVVVGRGPGMVPTDFFIGSHGKFHYQFGSNWGWQLPGAPTMGTWVVGSVVTPVGSTNGPTSTYTNGDWQETILCPNLTRTTNVSIGSSNQDYDMGGDVAEVIVYNRALSGLERRTIERYLSSKWSVPVADITCTMPSAATITCVTLSSTSRLCRVTVAVTGGTLTGASYALYYGASGGATSASGLTHLGSGPFTFFRDTTLDVTVPATPIYMYVKITSPFGADGVLFGNATSFQI